MPRSTGRSIAVLVAIALAGCSTGGEAVGGDALPVQDPSEDYGHESGDIGGTVALDEGGCWTIDLGDGERLLVFPAGYTMHADGSLMLSPDGTVDVGDGDVIAARGGVVAAKDFPGVPDGYWGNYLDFCQPPIEELVVVDEIVTVTVP